MSSYPYGNFLTKDVNNKYDVYLLKMTSELCEQIEDAKNFKEITLTVDDKSKSGRLKLGSSDNCHKQFDISFNDCYNDQREIFHNRSNQLESLGTIKYKITAKATQNSYDMTKKRISYIEGENKKHTAKELKLERASTKSGVHKIVDKLKQEKHVIQKQSNCDNMRMTLLHLLALQPMNKEGILSNLFRYGCKANWEDVRKHLTQFSTISKNCEYQLMSQFYSEVNENWKNYTELEKKKIINIKRHNTNPDKHSNDIIHLQKSVTTPDTTSTGGTQRGSVSLSTKIDALDMLEKGIPFKEVVSTYKIPDSLLSNWKSNEFRLRQMYHKSSKNNKNTNSKNESQSPKNCDEDSNSSFKTPGSNDEGFISGGDKNVQDITTDFPKQNSLKSKRIDNMVVERKRQNTTTTMNVPDIKRMRLSSNYSSSQHQNSSNENHSSSSCDVTPRSDMSPISSRPNTVKQPNLLVPQELKTEQKSNQLYGNYSQRYHAEIKGKYKTAFEEYSKLHNKLRARFLQIKKLRNQCLNRTEDFHKLQMMAKALLADMRSSEYRQMIDRVNQLEIEMSEYIKVFDGADSDNGVAVDPATTASSISNNHHNFHKRMLHLGV